MIRLKELRLEKGLSQEDVAQYLGITQQAYANYERGARQADYENLRKLSEIFGTTIDYILGKSDIRSLPNGIANMPSAFHNGAFDGLDEDDFDFLATVADGLREKKKKQTGV